jgi:hypothetical protein
VALVQLTTSLKKGGNQLFGDQINGRNLLTKEMPVDVLIAIDNIFIFGLL